MESISAANYFSEPRRLSSSIIPEKYSGKITVVWRERAFEALHIQARREFTFICHTLRSGVYN